MAEESNAAQQEENQPVSKEELQYGPASRPRSFTDAWCLIVLLAAWGAYVFVTILGLADGNPAKLYLPRDFKGDYCEAATNWGTGDVYVGKTDLSNYPKLSYTMNVTAVLQGNVKQLLCSTAVSAVMTLGSTPILPYDTWTEPGSDFPSPKQIQYLSACCLMPSVECSGSFEVGGDISNVDDAAATIKAKMDEITGKSAAADLFSAGGANGEVFQDMWEDATANFNQVCLPTCNIDFANTADDGAREWTFSMADDDPLKEFWDTLVAFDASSFPEVQTIQSTITDNFKFKALSEAECPYNPKYCIPMPGIEFSDTAGGRCSFEMSSDVQAALTDAVASSLTGMGDAASSITSMGDSVGTWVGDFEKSIGTFILVCVLSFVIGFIYLTVLRFTVGFCVWLSVFLAFVFLILGGYLCIIQSVQCAGSSLFETGTQVTVALAASAEAAINSAITGESADENCYGEHCEAYSGMQQFTINGNRCAAWGASINEGAPAMAGLYNPLKSPQTCVTDDKGVERCSGLFDMTQAQQQDWVQGQDKKGYTYCRNPTYPDTKIRGETIWCWTTNPEKFWEECMPIGVIVPECDSGYAVEQEELRTVLLITGYVIFGLAGLYLIACCCFANRIRLAIAVNKVATIFVKNHPAILVLPVVQALVCALWTLVWVISAAFLLSQVSADSVPKETFVSYAVAYGTSDTPGQCTGEWPQGLVWKDEENCIQDPDTLEWGCWKCAPPRMGFDWRFWVSYFVFLWNHALNVAVGQCVLAGACGIWFFTANQEKGNTAAIKTATVNALKYHLGSLAFGSFIIAVIQFIRTLMKYYEEQAKAQKNKIVVLILKIGQCIIWCLEKCVQYLNKNAYIQIALMGTNFCTSAKKAFFLILRNAIRFGVVAILGGVIEKIGMFFITGVTTAVGYLIFNALHPDLEPAVPVVIYFFLGYFISRLFTSVFSMAVDTTLQCFLACEEMELAVAGPEGFVPEPLESWLDTSKKAEDVEVEKQ